MSILDHDTTEDTVHDDTSSSLLNTKNLRKHDFIESANLPVARQLVVALGLLGIVFGTSYFGTISSLAEKDILSDDVIVDTRLEAEVVRQILENPFDEVKIIGKSAFVWDVRDQKVLFNKNADEILPLASITKLMTALVAYELMGDDGSINISTNAIDTDGDSGLLDGEQFSFQDLTDMVLVASSNDGATALGAAAGDSIGLQGNSDMMFVEAMNIRAEELGLSKTSFLNPTGLDISKYEAGAYSSAHDVALLMEYIVTNYPHIVARTTDDTATISNNDGQFHTIENTNEYVEDIEGIIASKTGYTELAGGNLVVAFNIGLNHPVIVVVLGSSTHGRFTDVKTLIGKAREYILNNESQ